MLAPGEYQCKFCDVDPFPDQLALGRHIRAKHPDKVKQKEEDTRNEPPDDDQKVEEYNGRKDQPEPYKPTTPRGIIADLIASDYLHLTPIQQAEIMEWVDDYEGVIPPSEFEKLLGNFKGIGPDKAKRTNDHYVMKLQKLMPQMRFGDIQRLELPISYGGQDHTGGMGSFTPDDFSAAMEGALERLIHKSRLLQNPDILTKPAEKILMNVADTTGIISRFMNIFFLGIEGQVRENPYIIGDASKILPKIPKLLDMGLTKEEEQQRKESEGTSRSGQAVELYKNEVKATPKPAEVPKRVSLTELDALFSKKDEEIKESEEGEDEE